MMACSRQQTTKLNALFLDWLILQRMHPAADLRETCQAGDVTVTASNESNRDSIFRSAVNMGLKAALQENAKLAGLRPQQFVSGIAKDLGAHLQKSEYKGLAFLQPIVNYQARRSHQRRCA